MTGVLQKKVCMLGAHGVGKTSLVQQYVNSIFSEKYHSTIGVKIDKRDVEVGERRVRLMLWDVAGEEEHFRIPTSFLTGSSGCLLVVDGTRTDTVDTAWEIRERLRRLVGRIPLVLVLNKSDLIDEWQIDEDPPGPFSQDPCTSIRSSAKTGEGVVEAFTALTRAMLE